jgi:hypothetical protein
MARGPGTERQLTPAKRHHGGLHVPVLSVQCREGCGSRVWLVEALGMERDVIRWGGGRAVALLPGLTSTPRPASLPHQRMDNQAHRIEETS